MLVEGKLILTNLDNDPQIVKMNKFAKITDMIFNLNELDNSDNLEDGRPRNTLFMIVCLVPKILCISNQKYHNIRN